MLTNPKCDVLAVTGLLAPSLGDRVDEILVGVAAVAGHLRYSEWFVTSLLLPIVWFEQRDRPGLAHRVAGFPLGLCASVLEQTLSRG